MHSSSLVAPDMTRRNFRTAVFHSHSASSCCAKDSSAGQLEYFALCRAHPIHISMLDFLCMDEDRLGASRSRFDWRKIARHGINEQLLAFDRFNVLRESSPPIIVHSLQQGCGLLPPGERAATSRSGNCRSEPQTHNDRWRRHANSARR